MSDFGNPSPQWTQPRSAASVATRLVPVRYGSGWILLPNASPQGAFARDASSGGIIIDSTITSGLKPTRLPSGGVIIY